eukprot:Nk52_evm87s2192 gene=Nk52_evmTU87s2192
MPHVNEEQPEHVLFGKYLLLVRNEGVGRASQWEEVINKLKTVLHHMPLSEAEQQRVVRFPATNPLHLALRRAGLLTILVPRETLVQNGGGNEQNNEENRQRASLRSAKNIVRHMVRESPNSVERVCSTAESLYQGMIGRHDRDFNFPLHFERVTATLMEDFLSYFGAIKYGSKLVLYSRCVNILHGIAVTAQTLREACSDKNDFVELMLHSVGDFKASVIMGTDIQVGMPGRPLPSRERIGNVLTWFKRKYSPALPVYDFEIDFMISSLKSSNYFHNIYAYFMYLEKAITYDEDSWPLFRREDNGRYTRCPYCCRNICSLITDPNAHLLDNTSKIFPNDVHRFNSAALQEKPALFKTQRSTRHNCYVKEAGRTEKGLRVVLKTCFVFGVRCAYPGWPIIGHIAKGAVTFEDRE